MYNDKLIKQFEKEMSIEFDSFYAVKQQYIKWLENKVESAMCEANSNAVLGEVSPRRDHAYSGYVFKCGHCDSLDIVIKTDNNGSYKHNKYCPNCGYKVNWRNFA